MKKISTLIGAVLLAAITTFGQGVPILSPQTISLGSNTITGTTTWTVTNGPGIVLKQQQLALTTTQSAFNGAAGSTNTFTFATTADLVNYDTNAADVLTFYAALVGPGPLTTVTNINTAGLAGLKLIKAVSTSTATNLTLGYAIKIQSP